MSSPVRVKICGLLNAEMAVYAAQCGADALGFVHYAPSPRFIEPAATAMIVAALPPLVGTVSLAVKVSAAEALTMKQAAHTDVIQFYGSPDEYGVLLQADPRAIFATADEQIAQQVLAKFPQAHILFDGATEAHGGMGVQADWSAAARLARQTSLVLAGGLHADNVAAALHAVQPWGVDVSSGVESSRGVKSRERISQFITEAKRGIGT